MTPYVVTIGGIECTVRPDPIPGHPRRAIVGLPGDSVIVNSPGIAAVLVRHYGEKYRPAMRAYASWLNAREAAS